ncbi:hypothetical protein [Endozoicomonas sp. OPT23]|uniref:hypothetical protein n=1 Tax=Endozoicomonas sp. OPT23 TaxID=2072845 RepID=UPI00129AE70A|nr:hypothetical protein [Endozoicomonas sp. OPT23]
MMLVKPRWRRLQYLVSSLIIGSFGSNAASADFIVNHPYKESIEFIDVEMGMLKHYQINPQRKCFGSKNERDMCSPLIEKSDGFDTQGPPESYRRRRSVNDTETNEENGGSTDQTDTQVTTISPTTERMPTEASTTAAPRVVPTQTQLTYAAQHCQGGSFHTTVIVSPEEDLWSLAHSYIDQRGSNFNSNYRVSFADSEGSNSEVGDPWEFDGTNRKGVLFLLPAGSSYSTTTYLDYFDDRGSDYSAPRVGLCALSGEDQENAQLNLIGASCGSLGLGDCARGRGFQTPPLRIQFAQVEMYRVRINGDQVDASKWGIRVSAYGKLILDDVRYTRTQDADKGLITLWAGHLGINRGHYRLNSSRDTALMSLNGRAKITHSNMVLDPSVYAFVSDSVDLDVSHTRFQSNAAADRTYKPVLFYSTYEGGGTQCTRQWIETCQASSEPWRIWPNYVDTCDGYLRKCLEGGELHELRFNNNTFTGHWSAMLAAYLPNGETAPNWFTDTFLLNFTNDSEGNINQGTIGRCAIDGATIFNGNMLINNQPCLPPYLPAITDPQNDQTTSQREIEYSQVHHSTLKNADEESGAATTMATYIVLAVFTVLGLAL